MPKVHGEARFLQLLFSISAYNKDHISDSTFAFIFTEPQTRQDQRRLVDDRAEINISRFLRCAGCEWRALRTNTVDRYRDEARQRAL